MKTESFKVFPFSCNVPKTTPPKPIYIFIWAKLANMVLCSGLTTDSTRRRRFRLWWRLGVRRWNNTCHSSRQGSSVAAGTLGCRKQCHLCTCKYHGQEQGGVCRDHKPSRSGQSLQNQPSSFCGFLVMVMMVMVVMVRPSSSWAFDPTHLAHLHHRHHPRRPKG